MFVAFSFGVQMQISSVYISASYMKWFIPKTAAEYRLK